MMARFIFLPPGPEIAKIIMFHEPSFYFFAARPRNRKIYGLWLMFHEPKFYFFNSGHGTGQNLRSLAYSS
jgi:hypothetical protein